MTLMHPILVADVQELLTGEQIDRANKQVDHAIQAAMELHWAEAGHTCDPETLANHADEWDHLLEREHGVFDLLDVDVEKDRPGLTDRLLLDCGHTSDQEELSRYGCGYCPEES